MAPLAFTGAAQLEVVMQWRHPEDPTPLAIGSLGGLNTQT